MSDTAEEIVAKHWSKMAKVRQGYYSWTESPFVMRHVNRLISGDPEVGWLEYACRKYLLNGAKGAERGLSIGCGTGALERGVRRMDACAVIDACDIAPGAIEKAKALASREGVNGIHYRLGNLEKESLPENDYDVVFASMAVHHFENLEHLYAEIKKSLKPGGHFIMIEYVGPSQFQMDEKIVRIINETLQILPPRFRRQSLPPGQSEQDSGKPSLFEKLLPKFAPLREVCSLPERMEYQVPSVEYMNAVDPSEAIRSSDIIPLLNESFTIVEKKDFGGTINHMLLHSIIDNFEDGTDEGRGMLALLLYIEELLMRENVIESDFSFIVAKNS